MLLISLMVAAALTQQPPVPQPFPRPGTTPVRPAEPGSVDAAPPSAEPPPSLPVQDEPAAEALGVTVYPGAQFITSYDAGRGQRFYLYGTSASFTDLVTYYRNILRERGDLVFRAPATHQFNTGRFRGETMAFPPSVTIKDYESAVSRGYPNPVPGGTPEAFRTIIQIVPAPPPAAPARR
jgi:hypothetical protein